MKQNHHYTLVQQKKQKQFQTSNYKSEPEVSQKNSQISTLCTRNFQNVKLRLDFVDIWSFYCHSDFKWNQILTNSYGPKMSFMAILETELWILVNFGLDSCSNLLKIKIQNF